MGYDRDGYETYTRSATHHVVDQLDPGMLYPGGAHVTWAKTRGVEPWFPPQSSAAEPPGAAAERRKHRAEDRQHERAGDRLTPIDPGDPWSEVEWRPSP